MGRAIRTLATMGFVSFVLMACSGNDLPTDPTKPTPTPLPIPTPFPTSAPARTAAVVAAKADTVFKNVLASWQSQAYMSGIAVNGSDGDAEPGSVKGPSLASFFSAELVGVSGSVRERAILSTFADLLTDGFQVW